MEPAQSANRLERFTNTSGSINFHLWKQLFIASINAKGLEHSLQNQEENDLTAAKLLAANKADALLLFELLSSIDKEPRQWAILNHPITEQPIQWAGFSLWKAIKKRYELKAIPQEVHLFKINFVEQSYLFYITFDKLYLFISSSLIRKFYLNFLSGYGAGAKRQ